jgi:hypothetical protein
MQLETARSTAVRLLSFPNRTSTSLGTNPCETVVFRSGQQLIVVNRDIESTESASIDRDAI